MIKKINEIKSESYTPRRMITIDGKEYIKVTYNRRKDLLLKQGFDIDTINNMRKGIFYPMDLAEGMKKMIVENNPSIKFIIVVYRQRNAYLAKGYNEIFSVYGENK